jgi:hypothetical protein
MRATLPFCAEHKFCAVSLSQARASENSSVESIWRQRAPGRGISIALRRRAPVGIMPAGRDVFRWQRYGREAIPQPEQARWPILSPPPLRPLTGQNRPGLTRDNRASAARPRPVIRYYRGSWRWIAAPAGAEPRRTRLGQSPRRSRRVDAVAASPVGVHAHLDDAQAFRSSARATGCDRRLSGWRFDLVRGVSQIDRAVPAPQPHIKVNQRAIDAFI